MLLIVYSHFPAKASPRSCEALKDLFQIYGNGSSLREAQDGGENFSIGAVQRGNSTLSVFLRGFAGGGFSQGVGASPPSALSSPSLAGAGSWVEKSSNWGCGSAELGLCPGPARPQPRCLCQRCTREGKGAWGHFLVPGAAQEGSSGHGEPGNSWAGGKAGRRNSSGRIYPGGIHPGGIHPGGWDGAWKRGESPKRSLIYSSCACFYCF